MEILSRRNLRNKKNRCWPSAGLAKHPFETNAVFFLIASTVMRERLESLLGRYTHCGGNKRRKIQYLSIDTVPKYYNLFTTKSNFCLGILNIENSIHRFILHYIFLPRINIVLRSFTSGWNKHPLRTERNWSPERLWTNGMIDLRNVHQTQVAELHNNSGSDDLHWYGFDPHAPSPTDSGLEQVDVEEVSCPLGDEQLCRLGSRCLCPCHFFPNYFPNHLSIHLCFNKGTTTLYLFFFTTTFYSVQ